MCGVGPLPQVVRTRPARLLQPPPLGILGWQMAKTTPAGPGLGRRSAALTPSCSCVHTAAYLSPPDRRGEVSPMSLGHQWVISEPKTQTSRSGGISPGIKISAQFRSFAEEDALLYSSWSVSVPGRGHSLSFFLLAA